MQATRGGLGLVASQPELQHAINDLRHHLALVHRPTSCLPEIQVGLIGLREVLHACSPVHQEALARSGMVDWTVDFVAQEEHATLYALAFGVLGDMCLFNDYVSGIVGRHEKLKLAVLRIAWSPTASSIVQQMALRVLAIAADNWETHEALSSLIPELVKLLISVKHFTRANAIRTVVMFLGKFAYNPKMHPILLACDCIPPLLAVVQSNQPELMPVAASLAIANLSGSSIELPRYAVEELINAFASTLDHMPYPPGSRYFGTGWKIAMALALLCSNPANAKTCLQCGIMPVVQKALESTRTNSDQKMDPRLTTYSLNILWSLCQLND